jgi:hypothetical protein
MKNDEVTDQVKRPKQPSPQWLVTAVFGLLSAVAASLPAAYFSYRSAKVEAESKTSQVKAEADIGYQTLVKAVAKHEEHDAQQDHWISRIEGHVAAIEQALTRVTIVSSHRTIPAESEDGASEVEGGSPPPPKKKPKAMKLKFNYTPPAPIAAQGHEYKPEVLPSTLDKAVTNFGDSSIKRAATAK